MTLNVPHDARDPSIGGTYSGTFCPDDFGLSAWAEGTEVWYYIFCLDSGDRPAYFPSRANPGHAAHTGTVADYLEFSIFPLHQPGSVGTKILLVDAYRHPHEHVLWALRNLSVDL